MRFNTENAWCSHASGIPESVTLICCNKCIPHWRAGIDSYFDLASTSNATQTRGATAAEALSTRRPWVMTKGGNRDPRTGMYLEERYQAQRSAGQVPGIYMPGQCGRTILLQS